MLESIKKEPITKLKALGIVGKVGILSSLISTPPPKTEMMINASPTKNVTTVMVICCMLHPMGALQGLARANLVPAAWISVPHE